jgi:uncharacterized protein (DUF362 family)/ferredoxin-like protein FixX
MKSQVSIVRCGSYGRAEVERAVRSCVGLLGGIEKFIRPGSRLLIKPNLLSAAVPEKGVTTHPEIVRAAAKLAQEAGVEVIIGDGPSVWMGVAEDLEEVFKKTGMREIADELNIKLVDFNNPRWHGSFPLTRHLDAVDAVLSLPKFKTHNLTILTGAIKNLFGLVPGTYKTELHKRFLQAGDFCKMLVEIYKEAPPSLSIVDAVVAMEGEGPGSSGSLRNLGLILASRDAVALDSILSVIMGFKPEQILTTKEAARRQLGESDLRSIEVLGEDLKSLKVKPFILPATSVLNKIAQPLLDIAKNFIKFYPRINRKKCILCRGCVVVCPAKAISVKFEAIQIDYTKCFSCFCCQEACPHAAIRIKKSLLAKLVGL